MTATNSSLTFPFHRLSPALRFTPARPAVQADRPQEIAGDVRLSERLSPELLGLLEHYCAAHRHELTSPLGRSLAFTATVSLPVGALPFLKSESFRALPARDQSPYRFYEWQMTRPVEQLTHLHGVAGHGVTSVLYSRALAQVQAGHRVTVLARDLDAPLWQTLPGARVLQPEEAAPRDLPHVTVVLCPSSFDAHPVLARKGWIRWRNRLTSDTDHIFVDSVISGAASVDPMELNEYSQRANFTLAWNHVKKSALRAALEHMNQGQGASLLLRSRQALTLLAQPG